MGIQFFDKNGSSSKDSMPTLDGFMDRVQNSYIGVIYGPNDNAASSI